MRTPVSSKQGSPALAGQDGGRLNPRQGIERPAVVPKQVHGLMSSEPPTVVVDANCELSEKPELWLSKMQMTVSAAAKRA